MNEDRQILLQKHLPIHTDKIPPVPPRTRPTPAFTPPDQKRGTRFVPRDPFSKFLAYGANF